MHASRRRSTRRHAAGVTALAMLSLCGLATAADSGLSGQPAAVKELEMMYRGVGIHEDQGRVHVIYGVPMSGGLTPRDSASFWMQNHSQALGAGGSTFREAWSADFSNSDGARFTVFCYQQYIGEVPVEYGMVKVLVLRGPTNPVVYASGTVAPAPAEGLAAPVVNGATAVALVRAMEPYQKMPQWGKAEAVVYQGLGDWVAPARAWKFVGESPVLSDRNRKTFFVDAATGSLLAVRDEIEFTDVNGTVQGKGSPGLLPDEASNPPALLAMPEIKVGISGGSTAFSDRSGNFTITNPGASAVTVSSGVGTASGFGGMWSNVVPSSGSAITASQSGVVPPGPASLIFNNSPTATATAQVNAFIAETHIHDYFRDRSGSWNRIDTPLPAHTAVSGTCNAFFDGSSINFYNAGGGCVNSAYSTVVAHEYGHFIVSKLGPSGAGLPQNAFGEGYGDTSAMLSYDTPIVAQDFQGVGTNIRNPPAANVQYPCSGGGGCGGEIHCCGQLIAGIWWNIRTNMGAFWGSSDGLSRTQQMEVNWSLITTGGPNSTTAAGPNTEIEVLTVDDIDGNLSNGTPNMSRICPAFQSHNITYAGCSGAVPANNNCSSAIAIGEGTFTFNTTGATTDGPAVTCNGSGDPQVNQDIWYTYTATCTGNATVSLCGSSYDTKIAVYDGAGCPGSANSEMVCNDDFCNLQSQVTFAAVAGHQYKVRVGGYLTAFGTGTMTISCSASSCYPNCDNSTSAPILNVNDFVCFSNRFAAGDSYANCDGSTTPPVLNVNDFVCFANQFAAGCP